MIYYKKCSDESGSIKMAIKLIAVLIAGAVAAASFSGCKAVPSKEAVNAEITDADGIAYETRISVAEWADI